MKRTTIFLLLLLTAVFGLTACRGGNPPDTTQTTTQATTMATTEATTMPTTQATTMPTMDNGNGPLEPGEGGTQNTTGTTPGSGTNGNTTGNGAGNNGTGMGTGNP